MTGQALKLKRLSKDGTLVSIGVDMELAQALGAGDSFLPTNEPEFSHIHVKTAEELIEYFIRACYTHAKRSVCFLNFWLSINSTFFIRGVHDLKPHVTEEQFDRLMNFVYMKSKEEVNEFSKWIESLNNPKVQGSTFYSFKAQIVVTETCPISVVGS